jgi:hypothetical protein
MTRITATPRHVVVEVGSKDWAYVYPQLGTQKVDVLSEVCDRRRQFTREGIVVESPNIFERLLGITFEQKIRNAVAEVQQRIDSRELSKAIETQGQEQTQAMVDQVLKELRS